MTTLTVSPQVTRVMTGTAITMAELEIMVKRAAIISHGSGCNRRYHAWLLRVRGDEVLLLRKLDMTRTGYGRSPMNEECEDCGGSGCSSCGWVGEIVRYI